MNTAGFILMIAMSAIGPKKDNLTITMQRFHTEAACQTALKWTLEQSVTQGVTINMNLECLPEK